MTRRGPVQPPSPWVCAGVIAGATVAVLAVVVFVLCLGERRDRRRADVSSAEGEHHTATWTVAVEVPMSLPDKQLDSLFTAIADAAHEWEPEHRDGWDVSVSGYPTYGELQERRLAELEQRAEEIAAALPDLIRVAAYVSRGRGFVDVEPYPDAVARRALGALDDATLRAALNQPKEMEEEPRG